MPIESRCTNCGKLLRVGDEHAGRKARCPECGQIYTVGPASTDQANANNPSGQLPSLGAGLSRRPTPRQSDSHLGESAETAGNDLSSSSGEEYSLAPPPPWYMRTPEGQVYGPVERSQLDEWMQEGRITDDCHLREGEKGMWQVASQVYPSLARPASEFGGVGQATGGYYQGGNYAAGGNYSGSAYRSPHRGVMILVMGLCSLLVCPFIGVFAWVMGNEDLQAMAAGRMDPDGRGMTQAGQILGIIGSVIGILWICFVFLGCICGALDA